MCVFIFMFVFMYQNKPQAQVKRSAHAQAHGSVVRCPFFSFVIGEFQSSLLICLKSVKYILCMHIKRKVIHRYLMPIT